ncbi:MAG: hypothetical protein PCFJNLEI_01399 [Verrucomicrobiae bacterium]|nr:hypothetical protein [Verrucomicrobiae bacterium]
MKICDVCQKVVDRLQGGPAEMSQSEICGECAADILRRFALVEQRLAESKRQWRNDVITEWRRERRPGNGTATS